MLERPLKLRARLPLSGVMQSEPPLQVASSKSLYAQLGGHPVFEKVHKIFYDKVYAHPWLKKYFVGIDQKLIENQQTDFMVQALGGPERYCGKFPVPAHKHMFISEELFDLRHAMLDESLQEAGVPAHLRARWLKVDAAFKGRLTKKSVAECEPRFKTDEILNFGRDD